MRQNKDRVASPCGKKNKAKQSYEKIILKDNITTTYIEHKNRNTGTSVLIHPQNVEKQYH